MEKYNSNLLLVIQELRSDLYFYKSNNLINFEVSAEKVVAVLDLEALGGIKIHNRGEERITGTTIYEFQILIIQSAFDGIYQRCVKDVTGQSLENFESQMQTKRNLPILLKKLNQFIVINKIIRKQAQFLKILSDFEPKLTDMLEAKLKVKDLTDLKRRVKIKIKGSGFDLKTIPSKSSYKRGAYQLIVVPPSFG